MPGNCFAPWHVLGSIRPIIDFPYKMTCYSHGCSFLPIFMFILPQSPQHDWKASYLFKVDSIQNIKHNIVVVCSESIINCPTNAAHHIPPVFCQHSWLWLQQKNMTNIFDVCLTNNTVAGHCILVSACRKVMFIHSLYKNMLIFRQSLIFFLLQF